mmetsp:Transcript_77266/g.151572  ORF Transcript_77266/g.151572 Transcript_77266/m.151572 type:complete len:202 (+) Transcript_77266:504-1109(+)
MQEQDVIMLLAELPPSPSVLEIGPEGPAVRLALERGPTLAQPTVEPRGDVPHLAEVRDRGPNSPKRVVQGPIPSVARLLVVVREGHEGVPPVAADEDVLRLGIEEWLERIRGQVGLQEPAVSLRLQGGADDFRRRHPQVHPRRQVADGGGLLLSLEHELRYELLRPSGAALIRGDDDDVVVAGRHGLPLRGVEVVGFVHRR